VFIPLFKHYRGAFFALLSTVLLFIACSRPSYNYSQIQCPEGRITINGNVVTSGAVCVSGDTIETAASSFCFLSFKNGSFAVIYPGSRIFVGDGKTNDLSVGNGAMYLDILGRGCRLGFAGYSAESGKPFRALIISAGDAFAEIRMYSGSVEIGKGKGSPMLLRAGYLAGMGGGRFFTPRPLLDREIRDFSLLTSLDGSGWDDPARNSARWSGGTKNYLSTFDLGAFAGISALRNLNREKGPLSVVKTRSGKDIIGVMSIQGKMTQVLTVNGEIRLPTKDVKAVTRYSEL
jgi:hypothetical protein